MSIPILKLPTSDYDQIRTMHNQRLIHVLRTEVLAPDRLARFSPRPPREHDAYVVVRLGGSVKVNLLLEGRVVFHCVFLPTERD